MDPLMNSYHIFLLSFIAKVCESVVYTCPQLIRPFFLKSISVKFSPHCFTKAVLMKVIHNLHLDALFSLTYQVH